MLHFKTPSRRQTTAIPGVTLAVLAALALAASGALAGARSVHGEVVDQVVTDGSCTAILCTRGVYSGTIRGTFEFAITSLQERLHFAGTEGRGIYTGEVRR